MCFIFFHKWTTWVMFKIHKPERRLIGEWGLSAANTYYQQRRCEKCGKHQVKELYTEVLN